MVELNWTEEANLWLEDIFEYIALENPDAAHRVAIGIYEKAQTLKNFPHSGYHYQASTRDVQILLYGHYRIAYLIKPDDNIDILGVFHGSLEISKYNL